MFVVTVHHFLWLALPVPPSAARNKQAGPKFSWSEIRMFDAPSTLYNRNICGGLAKPYVSASSG